MKHWKPLFIKNSRIMKWLSFMTSINIIAITLGPIVIYKDTISEETKNHETIHFQQYLETAFIGFLVLYLYDYIVGYLKYKNSTKAYFYIRAEREAYFMHGNLVYRDKRVRWKWLRSDAFPCLFDRDTLKDGNI